MSHRQRLTGYNVYEDPQAPQAPPTPYYATGSESTSSVNSSVPEHHHAVASTPHPYRSVDGKAKPSMRSMQRIYNDENIRRNQYPTTGSRTGSSSSNSSLSSSTGGSTSYSGRSATGAPSNSSYGSSQFYYHNNELVDYPTEPSDPHFYDRENLRPAPPYAVPSPHRTQPNTHPNEIDSGRDQVGPPRVQMVPINQNVQMVPMDQNPQMVQNQPMAPIAPRVPNPATRQLSWHQTPLEDIVPGSALSQRQQAAPRGTNPNNISGETSTKSRRSKGSHKSQKSQKSKKSKKSARKSGSSIRRSKVAEIPAKPGKTKVAIKLSSLRTIVDEQGLEADDVIIIMTVPDGALEDYTRIVRNRPRSRGRRPSKPKRILRDINE